MDEYFVYAMLIGCTIEFWLLAICLHQLYWNKKKIKQYEQQIKQAEEANKPDQYNIHTKIISGLDGWGDFTAVFEVSASLGDTKIFKQQCNIDKLTEEKKASMLASAESFIEKCKPLL